MDPADLWLTLLSRHAGDWGEILDSRPKLAGNELGRAQLTLPLAGAQQQPEWCGSGNVDPRLFGGWTDDIKCQELFNVDYETANNYHFPIHGSL